MDAFCDMTFVGLSLYYGGESDSNAIIKLQITEKNLTIIDKAPNVFSQPNYGRSQPVSAGTRPWGLTCPRNIKSAVETVVCYVR